MSEIWKPVVGYEGYYEVSNYGRVKRLETRVNSNRGGRAVREKILKQMGQKENSPPCSRSVYTEPR